MVGWHFNIPVIARHARAYSLSGANTVGVDYLENGFQYHFELAMFCSFYLCLGLQTFKQAEIRYGKVPSGRRNVVISVPHLARRAG